MGEYNDIFANSGGMPGLSAAGQNAAVTGGTGNMGAMGGSGGGLSNFWKGNQTTVTSPNGTVTQSGSPGFFGQGGMAQMGIGAISTLGSLWNSFQQNKIAKKSLALQERTFETNLANQTKTYNTEMSDRIRTRYASERRDPSEAEGYIEKNKL